MLNNLLISNILLNNEKTTSIAKNHLLKDLCVPTGYFVNNINHKSIPILYNNIDHYIDDNSIDICFKLIKVNNNNSNTKKNKIKKNNKTKKKKN